MLKQVVLLAMICVVQARSLGQLFEKKDYPKNYFQWPVGAKEALAANFGELRPNHYHMGLDCKTEQKVNPPVYAAAEGFISKVKIDPSGFGRSIYIDHPNGLTTLYAHLNDFYPELETFVTSEQYAAEKWNITLAFPPGRFKVNKGDRIANSGNTGGSQGPHLHFEIRDTNTEKVLNPLLFGFPIADDVPPKILRLAVYDRTRSTYEQTPKIYSIKKINGEYVLPPVMVATDKISFAISAIDQYTGSANANGIFSAILFDNDIAIAGFEMDSISYDDTRYLNAHIDYTLRSKGGPFLQHLSRLPGYNNGIYKTSANDGVIELANDSPHKVRISVSDTEGNSSEISFILQRNLIPVGSQPTSGEMFYPNQVNIFEKENLYFYLPEPCLYDSFHFMYKEIPSAAGMIYQLHHSSVPLHQYFQVSIKGNAFNDTSKVVMKRSAGSKTDYKKAVLNNGWYKASFREFGNFQLLADNIPPVVTPIGYTTGKKIWKPARLKFAVTDNTEEIHSFKATIDGKWIRFSNDKGRNFMYDFDAHCPPGEHTLLLVVTDQAGNTTEKEYTFRR